MKRVTVEPISGLANRMMALDSAISYCRIHNYQLNLVWPLFRGLNTKFEDLFDLPDIIHSVSYPSEYSTNKIVINLKVGIRKLKTTFYRLPL